MEVCEDWAPWAFIKKNLKRTIASLELLGTLLCVKLWGARMKESGRGFRVSYWWNRQPGELIRGFQADVHEVSPAAAAHGVVGKGEQCLDLSWIPREKNQWADDLTNQKFDRFCMSKRLIS